MFISKTLSSNFLEEIFPVKDFNRWLRFAISFEHKKNARILSFSDPYFRAFRLNTETYFVTLQIQSKCGKIHTRKTLTTNTFYSEEVINSTRRMLLYYFPLFIATCRGSCSNVFCIIVVLQSFSKFPGKHMIFSYSIKTTSPSTLR